MKKFLVTIGLVATLLLPVALAPATQAVTPDIYGGCNGASNEFCKNKDESAVPLVKKIVNALLLIIGVIAVIMIIIGGIMYAVSSGDTQKITKAKNTIIYAVVGLVVALFSYAIVEYVFTKTK